MDSRPFVLVLPDGPGLGVSSGSNGTLRLHLGRFGQRVLPAGARSLRDPFHAWGAPRVDVNWPQSEGWLRLRIFLDTPVMLVASHGPGLLHLEEPLPPILDPDGRKWTDPWLPSNGRWWALGGTLTQVRRLERRLRQEPPGSMDVHVGQGWTNGGWILLDTPPMTHPDAALHHSVHAVRSHGGVPVPRLCGVSAGSVGADLLLSLARALRVDRLCLPWPEDNLLAVAEAAFLDSQGELGFLWGVTEDPPLRHPALDLGDSFWDRGKPGVQFLPLATSCLWSTVVTTSET